MPTFKIHIKGLVQGVGFRPFVHRIAKKYGLNGWVCNDTDGVHLEFNADRNTAEIFYNEIVTAAPKISIISAHQLHEIAAHTFSDFIIKKSSSIATPNIVITPDLSMCDECRRELHDAANRRFQYPFITCTNCGPRYSIVKEVPYDRDKTSMHPFSMCNYCNAEYTTPENRRYFSQTNSCVECGVECSLTDKNGKLLVNNTGEVIQQAITFFKDGKIIAVKGIGGFLLMCDATNEEAIFKLRSRKNRPAKPFAVIYPSVSMLKKDVEMSEKEELIYSGIASPIVLLPLKAIPCSGIAVKAISPNLQTIGVMQPYAPLLELLAAGLNKPVIATSGNLSGSPVFYEEKQALKQLSPLADYFILHNRMINIPQDDSVVQFSPKHQLPIFLRRSRGYAPSFVQKSLEKFSINMLATGADLKSTFTLIHVGNIYTSQFLGDLENFDSQLSYQHTLRHLLNLLQAKPEIVLCDLHPSYYSTAIAESFARSHHLSIQKIQHHEAHFAAVLAENNLIASKEDILGVIWDGTGFGSDGQIWGGELFAFSNGDINRIATVEPFDVISGDRMSKEPRIAALSICCKHEIADKFICGYFSEQEWNNYYQLLLGNHNIKSSSMGRIFDGIASLLGLGIKNSYEAEAAMQLEKTAADYLSRHAVIEETYFEQLSPSGNFPLNEVIGNILIDLELKKETGWIALKFHYTLVQWVLQAAKRNNIHHLAFSGGVFQNALLCDLMITYLGKNHQLYFHQQLSPNDECISFGQAAHYYFGLNQKKNQSFNASTLSFTETKL